MECVNCKRRVVGNMMSALKCTVYYNKLKMYIQKVSV